MKKIIVFMFLLMMGSSALADQYVNGYYRQNGTYVQGHYRTTPNNTRLDNYSTRGNYNPYTGQKGYQNPYPTQNYNYSSNSYGYRQNVSNW